MAMALTGAVCGAAAARGADASTVRRAAREELLGRINRDRLAGGVPAVALDETFSAIADRHCERQIRERTVGHFSLDGLAPYARYSQAGSNDGIAENAVAWSAGYAFGPASIIDLARRSHEAMMAETPPDDSHRRAILDPFATHVAIGLAWEVGDLRLVQLFLRRHIDWLAPPRRHASPDEHLYASGRPRPGWRVAGATLHHESLPHPLSAEAANRIESYSLPPGRREFRPSAGSRPGIRRTLSRWAESRSSSGLSILGDGSFSFNAPLSEGPGIYTLVVWLARPGQPRIAASHISTIVREPRAGTEIVSPAAR